MFKVSILAWLLALPGCTSKMEPVTNSVPAASTTTSTQQETGSTTAATGGITIPAVDLDGLKTVTVDVGPLKGFTVQAPDGLAPDTRLAAELDASSAFPLEIDGNIPLSKKIRIGLPDALLAGIDLTQPETIAIYARTKTGTIFQLPKTDVSVEPPHLYVMVGEYLSLVVVQSRPALTITTQTISQPSGNPVVSWTSSPVGQDVTYELKVFDANCDQIVQAQTSKLPSAQITPLLAPGDYCVKVYAKVGDGVLQQSGEPLAVHILGGGTTDGGTDGATDGGGGGIPAFTFSLATGSTVNDSTPTISWTNEPKASDATIVYDIKICNDPVCSLIQDQATGLTAPSYTPGTTLAEGSHYITVTARSAQGDTRNATGSGSHVLKIDSLQPTAFSISGASNQFTTDTTPQVSWNAASDASSFTYEIKLSATSGCATPAAQAIGLTGTSYSPPTALAEGMYYVCLLARDAGGNVRDATNSNALVIYVDTTQPGTFSITGPLSTVTTFTPTVAWQAASDALTSVSYNYDLFQANCTTVVESQASVSGTSRQTGQLLNDTTYCAKITAVDQAGNNRQASNNGYQFTVTIAKPGSPTGLGGLPGSNNISLSWTTGGGATTGYLVVRRTGSAVTFTPVDGVSYTDGQVFSGNTIVFHPAMTTLNDTGLSSGTTYHYAVYAISSSLTYSATAATANATTSGSSSVPRSYVSIFDGTQNKILKIETASASSVKSVSSSGSKYLSVALSAANNVRYVETLTPPNFLNSSVSTVGGGAFSSPYQELSETNPADVSLAVDSTGKNHVAFAAYYNLKYAVGFNEAGWTAETIRSDPTAANGTSEVSIALDRRDVPHVVFVQYDLPSGGIPAIFYAHRASGSWTTTASGVLNKSGSGSNCATVSVTPGLAVDDAGFAHVVYDCNSTIVYATNKSGSWTYSGVGNGTNPAIVVTTDGVPSVIYYASANNVAVKTFDGLAWNGGQITSNAALRRPRIALDANGYLHAYLAGDNMNLVHWTNVSGSWTLNADYAVGSTPYVGPTVAIEGARNNGNLSLYAPELAMGYVEAGIKVMRKAPTWSLATNPSHTGDGNLVMDNNGWIYAGYKDTGTNKYLYTTNKGGSFVDNLVTHTVGIAGSSSLSVDSNDLLHAAFGDEDDTYFKVETSSGTWGASTKIKDSPTGAPVASVDLAVDGSNKNHVVYTAPDDAMNSSIYYSTDRSGSWTTTPQVDLNKNGSGTGCGQRTILPRVAATRDGKVWVSYLCTQQVIIASNTGGPWAYQGLSYLGTNAQPAITLDADEVPYIAFRDTGSMLNVKWGPTFGNSWNVTTSTGSVDVALAVDAIKTIHVIWQDQSYNIKHSWRTATGVTGSETIASTSNYVTLFHSIGISGVHGPANH